MYEFKSFLAVRETDDLGSTDYWTGDDHVTLHEALNFYGSSGYRLVSITRMEAADSLYIVMERERRKPRQLTRFLRGRGG